MAGTAESVLSATVSYNSIRSSKNSMSPDTFTLHATCIVWDCILRLWADDVYLPQLLHRFWKLCLQLCSRYQHWCRTSLKQVWSVVTVNETAHSPEAENAQRLEFLVGLHTDIEKLSTKMSNFTTEVIPDKLIIFSPRAIDLVNDCLKDTMKNFEDLLPLVTQEIISELLSPGLIHLRQISDIPRLFRRTNRDEPTKPCPYVKRALDFLCTFHADYRSVVPNNVNSWLVHALTSLTQQYLSLVKDVLISVQKTEESLRRLKKIRDKSAGVSTSESQVISDDEKIRIQLLIDVKSYIELIKDWGIAQSDIQNLNELLDVVVTATKNKREP
ncbi:conserved oligomeric Golgi complex subunit 2-like [Copidosoma floridanum]|uniref:conserved oligomeric Golgi complex subunit 2-like n=1 Tax=Copidosoma floridanum TaxID=29053 RepID=UPI0006C9C6E9|nr:conserved oligomeric Golgi complex subunit 2-like [Copidosoma floridanum]